MSVTGYLDSEAGKEYSRQSFHDNPNPMSDDPEPAFIFENQAEAEKELELLGDSYDILREENRELQSKNDKLRRSRDYWRSMARVSMDYQGPDCSDSE